MGHLSGSGLEPGRKPRLARAGAGMILAVKVREHDFMREERRPFKGSGAVGIGAADKLVLAVGPANQFGVAELSDDLAAVALGMIFFSFIPRHITRLGRTFAVHAERFAAEIGGRLFNREINCLYSKVIRHSHRRKKVSLKVPNKTNGMCDRFKGNHQLHSHFYSHFGILKN